MKNARNTQGISGAAEKAIRHCNPFKPNSQCAELLAILQSGQSLTHYQAAQMGIMVFTARIKEIRAAGFPVVCRMEPAKNKHGKTIKRGIYTLAV
jgi:hypothetical protein|nr:MAG TPA: helix-turn-helix domain protein [Caudoviricetes sp.]